MQFEPKAPRPRHGSRHGADTTDSGRESARRVPCPAERPVTSDLAWSERRRRLGNVVGPEVSAQVATLRADKSDVLVFEQSTLDARVPERPAAAQVAPGAHDPMGRDVVRAVVHRPTNWAGTTNPPQQPCDRAVGGDAPRRHGAHDGVHFFSKTRHGSIVDGRGMACSGPDLASPIRCEPGTP